MKHSVDAWLDELEGYSVRRERFEEGCTNGDPRIITGWLKAAYECGRLDGLSSSHGLMTALNRFRRLRRALSVVHYRRSLSGHVAELLDLLRDEIRDGERDATNALQDGSR